MGRCPVLALANNDRVLFTVVENMTEGVVIADLHGQLIHWNRAALALHGFTDSDQWLCNLTDFVSVFELSTLDGQVIKFEDWPMSRLLRGEVLQKLELRIRRFDSEWTRIMRYGGDIILGPGDKHLI